MVIYLFLFIAIWHPPVSSAEIDPNNTKDFEIYGIKLNSDSYSVVVEKLGDTKLVRPRSTGTGFDGPATFCYTGKEGERLTFIQGFSENYAHVTGYRLEAFPKKLNPNCKVLSKLDGSLRTHNGLGLGISKVELEKILGAPKSQTATSAKYSFEKKVAYEKGRGNIFTLDVKVDFDKAKKVKFLDVEFGGEPL